MVRARSVLSGQSETAFGYGLLWRIAVWVVLLGVFWLATVAVTQAATLTETKPGSPVQLEVPSTDLLVQGCVAPDSLVYVQNDGVVVGSTVSDNDGAFTQLLAAQQSTIHVVYAYYEDPDNRRSTTADYTVALPPQTTTVLDVHPAPTVSHAPGSVQEGGIVTFRGYACPGATVTLEIDGNITLTAVADASGYWTTTLNSLNFTVGDHVYHVSAAGDTYQTPVSGSMQFTIVPSSTPDTMQPVVAFPGQSPSSGADPSVPVVITSPEDGYVTGTRRVVITGTGSPYSQIEVSVDGQIVGSVYVNAFGEWTLPYTLRSPTQTVHARACDGTACGDASNTVDIIYRPDDTSLGTDCRLQLSLDTYRYPGVQEGGGIDMHVSIQGASPRYRMTIDWGDSVIGHQTLDTDRQTMHHSYGVQGYYNGKVTVHLEDDVTCDDIVYFSVRVSEATANYTWVWYVLVATLLAILFRAYVLARTKA